MTTQQLEALVFEHFPEDFLRRSLQAVYLAHEVSWRECYAEFASQEAENLLGYYKRAKLEGLLRDVAARYPNLRAVVEKGEGSNWFHTEIHGGPVVMTENAVQKPCALVDAAEFRESLARSNQGVLFGGVDDARKRPLYMLLLHSRSQWDTVEDRRAYRHLPGSAYIAFPASDLKSYIHEINLFERFPDVVVANTPKTWGEQAKLKYLRRSRRNWGA